MKYYVYSFIWKNRDSGTWYTGTGFHKSRSVVGLFEMSVQQPESWALTSFSEITKREYDEGGERGIIG